MLCVFFRDYFGKFITKIGSKVVILIIWAAYLGVAIWGCINITQGLQFKHLAPDDSYVVDFYNQDDLYFKKYGFNVQVVVHSPIDSQGKADDIEKLLEKLESSEYFYESNFTQSWLRDYHQYAMGKNISISYDNLFSSDFDTFIQEPAYEKYKVDIAEVEGEKKIFRFSVMGKNITDTNTEMAMMKEARNIASDYPALDVTVFSPSFIITEQFVAVLPNTLQNLGIAIGVMFVIALVLIPHPLASLWVTVSIVSIIVGVIGYMSLWGVPLDILSMTSLIMCIGFCVDFSAHITYAFVTSKEEDNVGRIQDALYTLGLPILQGSLSTILGIMLLSTSFSYMYRAFFKVMFLVILFGTLHGLFLLPVLLAMLGPKGKLESQKKLKSAGMVKVGQQNVGFEPYPSEKSPVLRWPMNN